MNCTTFVVESGGIARSGPRQGSVEAERKMSGKRLWRRKRKKRRGRIKKFPNYFFNILRIVFFASSHNRSVRGDSNNYYSKFKSGENIYENLTKFLKEIKSYEREGGKEKKGLEKNK